MDLKLERLEDSFQGSEAAHQAPLIASLEPLLNVGMETRLSPHLVVALRNVVDDVLNA